MTRVWVDFQAPLSCFTVQPAKQSIGVKSVPKGAQIPVQPTVPRKDLRLFPPGASSRLKFHVQHLSPDLFDSLANPLSPACNRHRGSAGRHCGKILVVSVATQY